MNRGALPRTRRALALGVLCLFAACSPAPNTDGSINTELDGNALRPKLPLMVDHGGGVLAAPEVYTVVWKGDEALGAAVDRFQATLMNNPDYWGVLAQYGVTGGSARGVVVLSDPPPATPSENTFGSEIVEPLIAAGALPTPGPRTVFAFLPPPTGGLDPACGQLGGFHQETLSRVMYNVSWRCVGQNTLDDRLGLVVSHELAEAATDPHPVSAPGWFLEARQEELADYCTIPTSISAPDGKSTQANRLYSNAAAAQGHGDPCQPTPSGEPYFNIAFPDTTTIQVDAVGDGRGRLVLSPFADAGVTELRYATSVANLDDNDVSRSSPVTFSKEGERTSAADLSGRATPGVPFSLDIQVRGARSADAEFAITVVVTSGTSTQRWSGLLVLTR